jgi:hypothetical protein
MYRNLVLLALLAGCATSPSERSPELRVSWEKNMLAILGEFPGGRLEIHYLEAYCRSGTRDRPWNESTIPHVTRKLSESPLTLRSEVKGGVVVTHRITPGPGEVDFEILAVNQGEAFADVLWAQPCIRVDRFTGRTQETYVERCFVFIDGKQTFLQNTRRAEEAIYRGGQLYIPAGIDRKDCNPRPHSPDVPSNGLIGCLSEDGLWLLATAWEPTQELFQGVRTCLHSDFRLGGLAPGETRRCRGKIYLMENNPARLLGRYRGDFS